MKSYFFSVLLFSSLGVAQSVQPGMWQMDSSVEVNGLPFPASSEKECLSKSDANDIKKTLTKELEEQGCVSTKWNIMGSKVEVSLKCSKSGLHATGNLKGSVTKKNYHLTGTAEGTYQGIPSEANFKLKGQWLKKCSSK